MSNDDLMTAMNLDMERRGLLQSSIIKRGIYLTAFARWLVPRTLGEATRQDVELFLDQRRTRKGAKLAPRSRYTWLANLHGFYAFTLAEGLTDDNPIERIIRPKLRRSLPRPAATADIRHLLEVANPTERCWVLLAGLQGLRCQEMAGISREDVLDTEGLLRVVHGKGSNERLLPLHPDVLSALKAMPMPRVGRIFTRTRGGAYTANWMSVVFNRFLHENGVESTAHQFRHWFGTQIYSSTHDIRVTQELLGHASPATTAIYTAFDHRAAKTAVGDLSFLEIVDPPTEAA